VTSFDHGPSEASTVTAPHRSVVPTDIVPEHRGMVAFISHSARGGDWILPRRFRAIAFLGGLDLDLTHARVGPGTSRIEVKSIMGSVTVIVPPDIRVECEGDSIIASFDVDRADVSPPADAPLVVITGTAVLGAVHVKVVDPNAPGWYEKIRRRWRA
jgi:Cell wall-active antibiotics response 4TMS YvqF